MSVKTMLSFCLVMGALATVSGKAKKLTDENFEHDTQATTGGTTGDWFV